MLQQHEYEPQYIPDIQQVRGKPFVSRTHKRKNLKDLDLEIWEDILQAHHFQSNSREIFDIII